MFILGYYSNFQDGHLNNMEKYSVYFWRYIHTVRDIAVVKELDPLVIVVCKIMTIASTNNRAEKMARFVEMHTCYRSKDLKLV